MQDTFEWLRIMHVNRRIIFSAALVLQFFILILPCCYPFYLRRSKLNLPFYFHTLTFQRNGFPRGAMGWQGAAQNPSSYIVKKIVRLEVPTDAYPNVCSFLLVMVNNIKLLFITYQLPLVHFMQFNFIGRLLGPRGHSLKRVEATTGCRVFIRGKGSIEDPVKVNKFSHIHKLILQLE